MCATGPEVEMRGGKGGETQAEKERERKREKKREREREREFFAMSILFCHNQTHKEVTHDRHALET